MIGFDGFAPGSDGGPIDHVDQLIDRMDVEPVGGAARPADETCPVLPKAMACQFSAFVDGPTANVHVVTKSGKTLDATVPVGSYNYCGRDIGYLRINAATLQVEEKRTLSPCAM